MKVVKNNNLLSTVINNHPNHHLTICFFQNLTHWGILNKNLNWSGTMLWLCPAIPDLKLTQGSRITQTVISTAECMHIK